MADSNKGEVGGYTQWPPKEVLAISVLAFILIVIHMLCPQLGIDFITLGLLVIVILPWILPYVKKINLPGGTGIETRDDLRDTHQYETRPSKEVKEAKPEEVKEISGLLPPIFEVTQALPRGLKREFPDAGFNIENPNNTPLRVKVLAKVLLSESDLGPVPGHYSGDRVWNLNPRSGVRGHFRIPDEAAKSEEPLEVKIKVTYIDQDNKEYELLPVGYVYMRDRNSWYFNP